MVLEEKSGEGHEFSPLLDVDNQWKDGEVLTHGGSFKVIVHQKESSLKLQLSGALTKQISNCAAFGYKTSVVVEKFVPAILGSIPVSHHFDRANDNPVQDKLVLAFGLKHVTPHQLEKLLHHIEQEVAKALAQTIKQVVAPQAGVLKQLRDLLLDLI